MTVSIETKTGAVMDDTICIAYPGMLIDELSPHLLAEGPFLNRNKSVYRMNGPRIFGSYYVESVAVQFRKEVCSAVTLHLIPPNDVCDTDLSEDKIVEYFIDQFGPPEKCGKTGIVFATGWGSLSCVIDFKLSALSIFVKYA